MKQKCQKATQSREKRLDGCRKVQKRGPMAIGWGLGMQGWE